MRTLLTTPLGWALLLGVLGLAMRLALSWRQKGPSRARRRGLPGALTLIVLAWAIPLVSATPFVAERVSRPLLERARAAPAPAWSAAASPEVIVVLGGGLDGPRVPGVMLSRETGRRLTEGVKASRRWPEARLLFSGGTRDAGEISSSQRMAEEARALGVPRERIVVEGRALSTRENALYVAAWLREQGVTRVALVTSAIHMPRSRASFAAEGFDVLPLGTGRPGALTPLPDALWLDASSFVDTTLALHEHIGLAYYGRKGWTKEAPR